MIRGRGLWLAVLVILGLFVLPAAAAQADDTWSGASTTSPEWSDTNNWVGNVAPVPATAGTLTFPTLGTCGTCYTSHNGLTNVSATGLSFTNTTGGYRILGNGLSVGSGGITDNPGGSSTTINAPLVLSANQTWMIGGGFGTSYNSLSVTGGVTGAPSTLTVPFVAGTGTGTTGDLYVGSDMELGQVTVTGSGGLHIGSSSGGGSVNGTNGNPVAINSRARLIVNPNSKVGALSVATGGELLLGTGSNNVGTVTLAAKGGVSIDSSIGTRTQTYISNNGSAPGTDFSQASATGLVTLGGQLILAQGPSGGGCATLTTGDVATLITTSGSLMGTFSNAANGAVIPMAAVTGSCPSPPQVQINYTANSVTATVMGATTPTTTTLATPNPSPAITNQSVTLTATVSATSGTVAGGTMAFSAAGNPIPGCTAQPVTGSGTSGTATCTTSFAAASSPESLAASFTGTTAAGQGSSISAPQSLTVTKASTATALAVSNKTPAAGGSVTYTATVTPSTGGASMPSGNVQFLDGGKAITGCAGRPVTAGSSSSTATCTVSYPSAGSHSITAAYGGDANFTGSASSATSVTVKPPPSPPAIAATTSPATRVGTTQATLNGSVSTGGVTVSWKFEYGRSTAYNRGTPLQTIAAGQHGTVPVRAVLKRLSPNVRYHYRLVVFSQASASAAAQGNDRTFKTRATGRLLGPSGRLFVIGRTILVTERCQSNVRCFGRFSLTTTVRLGKHKKLATVVCATRSFRIRPHRAATARVTLSGACSRLLRAQPHHRLVVTYVAQSRTGQVGLHRRITLVLR